MSSKKKSNKTVFGSNLMLLRKIHKLTQEEVAKILKIKRSTYAYYESETTPTLDVIKQLANLFSVSVHFLLYGTEDNIVTFPENPGLGQPELKEKFQQRELKRDENQLICYYRLLSSQNKEKIHKELKELFDNQLD